MDDIVSDDAEDALSIAQTGVLHRRDGVLAGFTKIFEDLLNTGFDVQTRVLARDGACDRVADRASPNAADVSRADNRSP